MSIQFRCANPRRAQVLSTTPVAINGIDFLEVLDHDAPAGAPPQRTLLVHMIKDAPWGLGAPNVRIEGGVRVTSIKVEWSVRAADAGQSDVDAGRMGAAERAFYNGLDNAGRIFVVRTDQDGDFSTYTLRLVRSLTDGQPPAGFDAILGAVEFSFKVECPSEFDCGPDGLCPPAVTAEPVIDYLARDYTSLRRLLLDRLAVVMPEWRERNPADLGMVIVEGLAYIGDYLSYYQDAVATEAYLDTARRRVSVRRHARLLDYPMHDGQRAHVGAAARRRCVVGVAGPHTAADARQRFAAAFATRLARSGARTKGAAGCLRDDARRPVFPGAQRACVLHMGRRRLLPAGRGDARYSPR
jgi:hypothetical protein